MTRCRILRRALRRSTVRASRVRALRSLLAALPIVAALLGTLIWSEMPARAGGPLFVGSPTLGTDGQIITWDTSVPVAYRVDGGILGMFSNPLAITKIQAMFDVWQNVPTATISYTNGGQIQATGTFADGDVSSVSELNEVDLSCTNGNQSPIVFDADGTLLLNLGLPPGVIGFAGVCNISSPGKITAAMAVMNGAWIDASNANGELTVQEFEQAFVHEFGHFSGLDHSQINANVLFGPLTCAADELAGLPLMFPFLACQARASAGLPILGTDDIAWISKLYPEPSFTSSYGFITGTVFFSDGLTHAQGVNVIARQVNNASTTANESRRVTFSVVSGYLFTANIGQNVSGTNPGSTLGSRNVGLIGTFEIPVTPGTYTIEVESIESFFAGGSSVGPLNIPMPSPGADEFWNSGESSTDQASTATNITVAAGQTMSNVSIILNATPPRYDTLESASLLAGPQPLWIRRKDEWPIA